MGRPGTGAMPPPPGLATTNAGQPPNSMLPPNSAGGTAPPPGVGPNANLQRGPMGIPGYTPGSVVGGQPPSPGGAPPIMPRVGPSQPGGNAGQPGIYRFPPPPVVAGAPPPQQPGFPMPGAGQPNGSINTLPTPNHSAQPGVGG